MPMLNSFGIHSFYSTSYLTKECTCARARTHAHTHVHKREWVRGRGVNGERVGLSYLADLADVS